MSDAGDKSARDELVRCASLLEPELRARVAAEWARDGQFEHASIASFGRFALELLALGAPPQLVEGAHRAALDEVRHAQLCFGIASVYAGTPLGPGPLPIDERAFSRFDLVSAARAAVLEGCIGETLATVEAERAAELAEPRAVRDALIVIAREESEHAALAYRFISWAVTQGGADVRAAVIAAFEEAIAAHGAAVQDDAAAPVDPRLAAHGRLCASEREALRMRALDTLIGPLAATVARADKGLTRGPQAKP